MHFVDRLIAHIEPRRTDASRPVGLDAATWLCKGHR